METQGSELLERKQQGVMARLTKTLLAVILSVGLMWPIMPQATEEAYAAGAEVDLQQVFNEWVNFPGAHLGSGYAAGWQYRASDKALMTTQNVGFTGYYNPLLMSFTTGTFAVNMLSGDGDPWGFAWGLQKGTNSAGQDTYSFYMYEECGCNHWCIAYIEEWVPAKDGSSHRGPVYHSTIDAADGQYSAHNGGKGSVGFAKGKVLAYGTATVKSVNHRVTMKVEKNKITVTSPQVGINAVVEAPVQAGSFGPVTASNSSAFYYNLSMEAAEDNGAIKADFQTFDDGVESSAGKTGDTLTMENRTWLDPATKATIKDTTWTVYDPSGKQIYSGTQPFSGVVDQEGEYRIVLEVLTSQGLTAKKTKYFTVSTESIVTVRYVDERGEKLTENIVYKGRIGKPYQTVDISFNGYVLAGVEGETSGVFADGPIGVTYSYKKLDEADSGSTADEAQPVTVRYVDQAGKSIMPDVVYRGAVGDPYTTSKLDIPGYTFQRAEERMESASGGDTPSGNTPDKNGSFKGNFGYQKRTVTYYYKADSSTSAQSGSVLVRYLDPDGHAIADDAMLTGKVGESFTIDIPSITKYKLETIDGVAQDSYTGTFTSDARVINVVYSPITFTASSVMVLYRDPDGNTIRSIVIDGNAGDPYTTEPLDIPGYELVEVPANQNGVFVADKVTQVLYQYKSTLNKPIDDGVINVDTDGDGLPDLNVDTDGDGKPDINIDTDGDGKPDKNVVTDDTGKPAPVDPDEPAPLPTINVDTDGDGKPDVNIDTDGDGVPDVNVVVDETGKPAPIDPKDPKPQKPLLNVDTDGDGKPDLNIDTDGDGKPDINVVTDDKGKPKPVDPSKPEPPNVNIYDPDLDPNTPKDPTKPNVNVDTDGNGIPDVNIDTDGDGEPDINIVDKDGDGKPDQIDPEKAKDNPESVKPNINVVVGEDGKPQPNINPKDPHSPKKPDINIDTDGDGKPDVNIDTTGDGKPNVNVDTTGDGKPNVNIDTTGDGKPDTNLDEDGDGIVDRTGDGPDTEDPAAPLFTISTKLKGAIVGAQISPTLSIAKGKDATITWTAGPHSYVLQVAVDGKVLPGAASYTLEDIDANHEIVVTMAPLPDIGGNTAHGYYTVSVNKYGGASAVEVSPSATLSAGQSTTVTWKPAEGYEVMRVLVNGVALSEEQVASGAFDITNIGANYVVDVVAAPIGGTPTLRENDLQVSTVIKGGPGSITGGSLVNRGGSYTVNWDPVVQTTTDHRDPNYAVYEVQKVEVNGHEVQGVSDGLTLSSIREDQNVVVTLKPVTYNVSVLKYGNGTVSPSVTKYKGQEYIDIKGTPGASAHISYVEVDGQPVFDETDATITNPFSESAGAAALADEATGGVFEPEKIAVDQADLTALAMGVSGIAGDHVVKVYFANENKVANPETLADKTITVVPGVEGGPGTVDGGGILDVNEDGDPVVKWEVPDGYGVKEIIINGVTYPIENPDSTSINIADIIGKDNIVPGTEYKVTLVTEKRVPGDDELPVTRELVTSETFSIDTSLKGGPGSITASGMVIAGDSYKVVWTVEDLNGVPYRVAKVIIDGVEHPELLDAYEYIFEDVSADHTIQVILEPVSDEPADEPVVSVPDEPQVDEEQEQEANMHALPKTGGDEAHALAATGDATAPATTALALCALVALAVLCATKRDKGSHQMSHAKGKMQ